MNETLNELIGILNLEQTGTNQFLGYSPKDSREWAEDRGSQPQALSATGRIFGGQVAAQALIAAGRATADKRVHSLHCYFLRPGDVKVPILFDVDPIRDGNSFSTRRVVASQHGKPILNLSASFHKDEDGIMHQLPMPNVPGPHSLPTFKATMAPWEEQLGEWIDRPRPFEQRFVGMPHFDIGPEPRMPKQQVWMRADGAISNDPLLHPAMATYASDLTLLDTVMLPHQLSRTNPHIMLATLDHSVWFHRPFRIDEWFLFDQESILSFGARALMRGQIFTFDGKLVASVAQEALIRISESR